jgi:hypothetical protein
MSLPVQAALRRAGDLRAARLAAGLRRAVAARLVADLALEAGRRRTLVFFFAFFAMIALSLFSRWIFCPKQTNRLVSDRESVAAKT